MPRRRDYDDDSDEANNNPYASMEDEQQYHKKQQRRRRRSRSQRRKQKQQHRNRNDAKNDGLLQDYTAADIELGGGRPGRSLKHNSTRSTIPMDDSSSYKNMQDKGQEEEEDEVYIVRQERGYLSILFSAVQTLILGVMMYQCGIAPMKIK